MRYRAALLLLGLFFVTNFSAESLPVIRKTVSEVHLTLVATDQQGRAVENLSPHDIAVLDEDYRISNFELQPASELPLRVGVVLDTSESNLPAWTSTKQAVAEFLQETLKPRDQAILIAFDSRVEMEKQVDDPEDARSLMAAVPSGGQTALYDALYKTCESAVFNDFHEPRRSALILFSDGKDNLSWHSLDQTIEKAGANGIAVYTISVHSRKMPNSGDAVLHRLAQNTGGTDFTVSKPEELRQSLMKISEDLRSSYLLYYRAPSETGVREFRRVRVLPVKDGGPAFRYKGGYYTSGAR